MVAYLLVFLHVVSSLADASRCDFPLTSPFDALFRGPPYTNLKISVLQTHLSTMFPTCQLLTIDYSIIDVYCGQPFCRGSISIFNWKLRIAPRPHNGSLSLICVSKRCGVPLVPPPSLPGNPCAHEQSFHHDFFFSFLPTSPLRAGLKHEDAMLL